MLAKNGRRSQNAAELKPCHWTVRRCFCWIHTRRSDNRDVHGADG